jgi:alpha-L-fucosidase
MAANGESIWATTASPTERPTWGRITTKAGADATTLYLHVFDWPADGKLPVAVTNDVRSCRLLADAGRTFEVAKSDAGLTVQLTGEAPDPICSVIALEVAGRPQVVKATQAR